MKKYRVLLPFDGWEVDFCEYDGEFVNGKIVILGSRPLSLIYGLLINEVLFDVETIYTAILPEEYQLKRFWNLFSTILLDTELKLNERVYEAYITTRKNKKTTLQEAELKIKRNLLLSHQSDRVPVTDRLAIALQYGYSRMLLHKDRVVNLTFKDKVLKGWRKDLRKYYYYSELLGIKE